MQYIEKDNSKFKSGYHTVKNRMQYKNRRTIEKQYKMSNTINNTNNMEPKIMNIIDTIKKLIVYVVSYCYSLYRQRCLSVNPTIEQRTTGVN